MLDLLRDNEFEYPIKQRLRIAIRQSDLVGEPLDLRGDNYLAIAARYSDIPVSRKRLAILNHVRLLSRGDSAAEVRIDEGDCYTLLLCLHEGELLLLMEHLQQTGHLRQSGVHWTLTYKGWEETDPLQHGGPIPGTCFLAMAFDPALESAYANGFVAAVDGDCGLQIVRVDKQEDNRPIDDRIVEGLRRAEVVVADCTFEKGGVYFEAGYALALDRQVVFTCRKADFKDGQGVHFDTRMYPFIVWEDEQDLRKRLARRLWNTVPSLKGKTRPADPDGEDAA